MKSLNYFLTIIFFITINFCFNSQETPKDTSLRLVEKIDGTQYIAKILSDDGREVLLDTEAMGKIYIPKSQIKRIAIIYMIAVGVWPKNPNLFINIRFSICNGINCS